MADMRLPTCGPTKRKLNSGRGRLPRRCAGRIQIVRIRRKVSLRMAGNQSVADRGEASNDDRPALSTLGQAAPQVCGGGGQDAHEKNAVDNRRKDTDATLVSGWAQSSASGVYLFKTRSAFASIFFLSDALSLPWCSIWEARALAFRAWLATGMGYLRFLERPNSDFSSAFFFAVVSLAIQTLLPLRASTSDSNQTSSSTIFQLSEPQPRDGASMIVHWSFGESCEFALACRFRRDVAPNCPIVFVNRSVICPSVGDSRLVAGDRRSLS